MAVNPRGFIGPRQSGGSTGALTADELRERLGLNADVSTAQVEALLEASSALVERFAGSAPTAVKNEAIFRVAGWMEKEPSTSLVSVDAGPVSLAWRPAGRNALRLSGAQSLLAPWRRPRALRAY